MKFNVDIKINSAEKIIKDHGLDDNGSVTEHFRNTVDRFMDPYIPSASTDLKKLKIYPNKYTIKYISLYSHYHYKGKLMLTKSGSSWAKLGEKKYYTNTDMRYQGAPKRGPEWDKRMMNDRKQDVINDIENFIKSGG